LSGFFRYAGQMRASRLLSILMLLQARGRIVKRLARPVTAALHRDRAAPHPTLMPAGAQVSGFSPP